MSIQINAIFPIRQSGYRNPFSSASTFPSVHLFTSARFCQMPNRYQGMICMAASTAGSPHLDGDESPYEAAYTRRRKNAERRGDEAYLVKLEKAYDQLMMSQLTSRKKGLTSGQFQVSKDIKYADKQPILPWGPRYSKSSVNDMRINFAISAIFPI